MRDHDYVGVDADYGARPPDVRVNDPLPQQGRLDIREVVGEKHGWFEMRGFWVVGGLDGINRLLFVLLDICSALDPCPYRRSNSSKDSRQTFWRCGIDPSAFHRSIGKLLRDL